MAQDKNPSELQEATPVAHNIPEATPKEETGGNMPFHNIPTLLSFYRQHWQWTLVWVVLLMALGTVYVIRKQPKFETTSNVLITNNDKESDLMRSVGLSDFFGQSATVDEEAQVVQSYSLFRDVVKALDLHKSYMVRKNFFKRREAFEEDTPVRLILPAGMADTLSYALAIRVDVDSKGLADVSVKNHKGKTILKLSDKPFPVLLDTEYGKLTLAKTSTFPKNNKGFRVNIGLLGHDAAAQALMEDVKVLVPNKKANVLAVTYKSTSKAHGQKVVDEIVDEYNAQTVGRDISKSKRIAEFIDNRLIEIASELTDDEKGLQDYQQAEKLTNLSADVEYTFAKRGKIEPAILEAETDLELLELTKRTLDDTENPDALLPTTLSMEAVAGPIQTYNQAVLQRMRIQTQAHGDNAMLASINRRIDAMRANIEVSLERTIAGTKLRLQDLKSQLGRTAGELGRTPQQMRSFRDLSRKREITEQIFLFLMKEREQTNMRISNALPKGVVIDRAYSSIKPSGLGKGKLLFCFFILGLAVLPGWAFALTSLRSLLGLTKKK